MNRRHIIILIFLALLAACAPRLTTEPEQTFLNYDFGHQMTSIMFNDNDYNNFELFLVGKGMSFVVFVGSGAVTLRIKELSASERDEIFATLEDEGIHKWKNKKEGVRDASSASIDLRVGERRRTVSIYPADQKEIGRINKYLLEEFKNWHEPSEEELARMCTSLPADMQAECARYVNAYRSFKEYQGLERQVQGMAPIIYSFVGSPAAISFANEKWDKFRVFFMEKGLSLVSFRSAHGDVGNIIIRVKELSASERDMIFATFKREGLYRWPLQKTTKEMWVDVHSTYLGFLVGDQPIKKYGSYTANDRVNQYLLEQFTTWHEPKEEEFARWCTQLSQYLEEALGCEYDPRPSLYI